MNLQEITKTDVIDALRDDRERQIKALQAELKCAGKLLGKPMLATDIETLRQKWALLIGDDE